jgi:hypothetical protein
VSAWRRRAIEAFPDLAGELGQPGFGVYLLFDELLARVRRAHGEGDEAALDAIYGFAAWCFRQRGGGLSNAAAVGFYEHLFDSHPGIWPDVLRRLDTGTIRDVMPLWTAVLRRDNLERVRPLIDQRLREGR